MQGNFEEVVFGVLVILIFQFAADGLLPRLRAALGWSGITRRAILPTDLPRRGLLAVAGLPALRVAGARRAFGGVVANDDVGITVNAGQIVALIGPNGAGKSTFFDLVTGVTRADAGTFELYGRSIAGRGARAIAQMGVARSFQHVRLVGDMSAIENVALGAHPRGRHGVIAGLLRANAAEERALLACAMRQLERVGLAEHAWQPAASLALGQQRLLEIARALAADPLLLLLDEPAAGLRHQEKQALATLIAGLRNDGLAVLLVEHDMDFVMGLADRVVVLEFGRVIAAGTPAAVQADERVQEAYLGAPA